MTTYKRVDGDYVIATINAADTITFDSSDVLTTGNFSVGGNVAFTDITLTGNLAAGNIDISGSGVVNGDLTVVGNLNANGNIAGDKISNGDTSIEIPAAGGNVIMNIGGGANTVEISAQGLVANGGLVAIGNVTGINLIATGSLEVTGNAIVGNLNATGVSGTLLTASQPNITSLGTLDSLTATGNVSAGNISATLLNGTVETAAQPNITSLGNLTALTVDGEISANGNVATAGFFFGDGGFLSNVTAFSNIGVTFIANSSSIFEVQGASGPLLAQVNGVANVMVLTATGANVTGNLGVTGNIAGNYILGNGAFLDGIVTSVSSISNGTSSMSVVASDGNIQGTVAGNTIVLVTSLGTTLSGTTVATDLVVNTIRSDDSSFAQVADGLQVQGDIETLGSLTAVGNISGDYVLGNGALLTGVITSVANINNGTSNVSIEVADGNITAGVNGVANVLVITEQGLDVTSNVSAANVNATSISGTITTAAQTNITSLGTLTSLTVNGLATHTGNIDVTGNINVTGNLDYTNVNDLVVGDPLIYIGANNTGNLLDLGFVVSYDDGLYQHGGLVRDHTDGVWKLFGNVEAEPTTTIDWGNAIYQPLEVGNITVGNIINQNANGVGNIGSLGGYFNTVFAKATSAQYADLAERYLSDADYLPGTVMLFGGHREITRSESVDSHRVAGVISHEPAHVMNAGLKGEFVATVALIGRVRCYVRGPVEPGDLLVSDLAGWARVNNDAKAGHVIGKSLERSQTDAIIEIVVGKH